MEKGGPRRFTRGGADGPDGSPNPPPSNMSFLASLGRPRDPPFLLPPPTNWRKWSSQHLRGRSTLRIACGPRRPPDTWPMAALPTGAPTDDPTDERAIGSGYQCVDGVDPEHRARNENCSKAVAPCDPDLLSGMPTGAHAPIRPPLSLSVKMLRNNMFCFLFTGPEPFRLRRRHLVSSTKQRNPKSSRSRFRRASTAYGQWAQGRSGKLPFDGLKPGPHQPHPMPDRAGAIPAKGAEENHRRFHLQVVSAGVNRISLELAPHLELFRFDREPLGGASPVQVATCLLNTLGEGKQ